MTIAEKRDDIHTAAVADPAQPNKPRRSGRAKPPGNPRVKALTRFAVSISALTFLGHLVLGFEQAPITPLLCLAVSYASALTFEALDAWTWHRRIEWLGGPRAMAVFLLPAHITALACAMLIYAGNDLWPYAFAVIVANGSKYLFRVRQNGRLKHVLNPSNTGIALTLLLFHWVGMAPPYMFTNNFHGVVAVAVPVVILLAGTMLNAKLTRKMPLITTWLAFFVLQAVARWLWHGDSLTGALLPLTGVAFILFTNYMITDPGSTPMAPRGQRIFGASTAIVYGLLVWNGIVYGLFLALVITCLLRGFALLAAPYARPRWDAWWARRSLRLHPPAAGAQAIEQAAV
jgi:hypothetical protein